MRLITKKAEPTSLSEFRNKGGTWRTFSKNEGKEVVQKQLLHEQNYLCAYCTSAINQENMTIEHWCPRSKCPTNRDLDYSNLFAVCKGCFNGGQFFHCDTSKADRLISIIPSEPNHINELSYSKATGKLISSNQTHQQEINSILN